MKAFDATVMFDSPEDAAGAAAALQAAGYELTINPDLKDEIEGELITPSVFGVIRGMMETGLTEDEISGELEEIVRPFNYLIEEVGYSSPDRCPKYDPRYDEFIRAKEALKKQENPDRDDSTS
jgi:hypothetical protein